MAVLADVTFSLSRHVAVPYVELTSMIRNTTFLYYGNLECWHMNSKYSTGLHLISQINYAGGHSIVRTTASSQKCDFKSARVLYNYSGSI